MGKNGLVFSKNYPVFYENRLVFSKNCPAFYKTLLTLSPIFFEMNEFFVAGR